MEENTLKFSEGKNRVLNTFICDICDRRFDEKTHLRQHIGHKHLPKTEKCPECEVMVNDISLVSHRQTHRKKHICEKCGRLFQTAKRLECHKEKICLSKTREVLEQNAEFMAKKFKCLVCLYRGPNERALRKHVQRVHRKETQVKEKTCEICNKDFSKTAYVHHVRTHGRIQCTKCFKWLSTGSGFFKQHMLNHEKEENETRDLKSYQKALGSDGVYRCYGDDCNYETHKKRLFVRHWQNKHGPKSLKCDYPGCDSGLMSEKQLWRHKNTHKRKDCQKCKAVFNDLRDLNRHLAKNICKEIDSTEYHSSNESKEPVHDLKCFHCDYTTYQANALIRHRLHYHAPIVGHCPHPDCKNKEMMTKAKLQIHMKRHGRKLVNESPCQLCGLVLSDAKDFERHTSICKEQPDSTMSELKREGQVELNKSPLKAMNGNDVTSTCLVNKMETNSYNLQNDENHSLVKSEVEINDSQQFYNDSQNDYRIKVEPEIEIFENDCVKIESVKEEVGSNGMIDPFTDVDASSPTLSKVWQCEYCDYSSENKKYLQNHINSKHNTNLIKCQDCDKLVRKSTFKKHQLVHIRPHICFICEKNFATRWKMKIHIQKQHPEYADLVENDDANLSETLFELTPEQLRCRQCGIVSSNIHEFRCHLRDHDPIKIDTTFFECEKCDYKSHKKKNLQYHMITVHDPNTMECSVCLKTISKRRYKKHMQTHTLEFACSLCPKRVSTRWNLKEHIYKNHPDREDLIDEINEEIKILKQEKCSAKPFQIQCAHCEYTTLGKRNFVNHFLRMHSITRYTCHYCGQSVNRLDYKRHLATHENPSQKTFEFMCEKCSRVFAQKRSLEVHILSCSGQIKIPNSYDFKCDICDYATGTKKSLRHHKYMVHAEKNSQCPICNKMLTKAKLSAHIRWHQNRLTCSLCQKSNFASRWHLKVHILKVHPGNEQLMADEGLLREIKPATTESNTNGTEVECPDCGKIVKQSRMSVHSQIHNKQFKCTNENCNKVFANKYSLGAHLKRCKNKTKDD